MEEKKFCSFNPMNRTCNYCAQNYNQDVYMYPFPGLPFGFENICDEDDTIEHEHKHSDYRDIEKLDEDVDADDYTRKIYTTDEILYKIEHTNPMILRNLTLSGIPYKSAKNMVRRIIYLTLSYSQKPPR